MKDIFSDIFAGEPSDPMASARRGMRPKLRSRFYRQATIEQDGELLRVLLDGKPVRTPAQRILAAPARPLADALATEWNAQSDTIDPAQMPLTRLANVIIDAVADAPEPFAKEVESYLKSDLVFYRAAEPDGLVASQNRHWDPLLAWAADALGARFVLAQDVMHVTQPDAALVAASRAIARGASRPIETWRLGALASVTTSTGSALIALALAAGRLDADAASAAANVDEDWNIATWGEDVLAIERRAARRKELQTAALVLDLLR